MQMHFTAAGHWLDNLANDHTPYMQMHFTAAGHWFDNLANDHTPYMQIHFIAAGHCLIILPTTILLTCRCISPLVRKINTPTANNKASSLQRCKVQCIRKTLWYVTFAAFAKCLLCGRLAHCPRESKYRG